MSDKPLKSDKLHYKISYNEDYGTWLYGRYHWLVRDGAPNFTTYGQGWARTSGKALERVKRVIERQNSGPSVYTVEEGEL